MHKLDDSFNATSYQQLKTYLKLYLLSLKFQYKEKYSDILYFQNVYKFEKVPKIYSLEMKIRKLNHNGIHRNAHVWQ